MENIASLKKQALPTPTRHPSHPRQPHYTLLHTRYILLHPHDLKTTWLSFHFQYRVPFVKKLFLFVFPFQNTYDHVLRTNTHKKNQGQLTVRGEGEGVNPYGQPDREKTVFYDRL